MNQATVILEKYPQTEDWHIVQFSDKIHFGYGTNDKLRIIQKAGICYFYPNCTYRKSTKTYQRRQKMLLLLGSYWAQL